jgi:uncharacterized protein YbjT (DUF2867 family)
MATRYLVVGASGTVGSRIVESLAASGAQVRALTSRQQATGRRDGVEWVQANLATGEGVAAAFEGVDRAFILVPPGYADQHAIASPLIAEARRRKLDKVVLMTAMGANAAETPLLRAERELIASGVAYNIIRPNWFMQNFQTFWIQGINERGKIALPVGSGKASFIDASDIAAAAVRLLTTHDLDNRDFDLTGPRALDHDEVARILSQATGRKIAYQEVAPDVLRQGLLAGGVPADYTEFLLVILDYLRQGYAERTTDEVKRLTGREPIAFEQYARDNAAAWKVGLAA